MAQAPEERQLPDFSSGLATEYAQIERDYRRKVTFLEARPKFEQGFLLTFFFIDALLLLFFAATIGLYVVYGSFADNQLVASTSLNARFTRAAALVLAPQSLAAGEARFLDVGAGRYDLYGTVENPNRYHFVTFDYGFLYDGAAEPVMLEGFLNPGESLVLPQYGVELSGRPQNPRLILENISFTRVDRGMVPDIDVYLADHTDFSIDQAIYTPDQTSSSAVATFSVTNRTPYSYWEPAFLVSLMRGSSVVALTTVTVPRFSSGEDREVSVRFFGSLPATATVTVTPVIPYFDPQAYMSPRGVQLQDLRDVYLLD